MKKNKFYSMTMLSVLMLALGLTLSSCSDDDEKADERLVTEDGKTYVAEDQLTEQEEYLLDCQFAIISTMQHLAGLDEAQIAEVTSQTFEPTYGKVLDESGPMVRAAKCDSIADAEVLFRSIAGLDSVSAARLLTPTPDGYRLDMTDLPILPDGKRFSLGVLTFHRDGGPRRYGYVDVEIPCIPHLERIDFLSPEAFPDNAGNSAYQLGDIVSVSKSSGYCEGYYVCVQPYYYTDGYLVHMGDVRNRYWGIGGDETINVDGDDEGAFYPYNKSKGQPTNYDIIQAYCRFITENQDKVANIKTFLRGEAKNLKPSSPAFLYEIFPGGFNNERGRCYYSGDKNAAIWYDAEITGDYAWWPPYHYRKGYYGQIDAHGAGMWDSSRKYVRDSYWKDHWDTFHNYCMNVIRFSTKEIAGSTLEYSPLNDVLETGLPATEATTAQLGWWYADDDCLYETDTKAKAAGHTLLGKLAYVNDGTALGDLITEKENGGGHGLVVAYLRPTGYTWRLNPANSDLFTEDNGYTQYIGDNMASARADFGGWNKTQMLYNAGSPAAKVAVEYSLSAPMTSTGWFIPSTGQWLAMFCGSNSLGGTSWPDDSTPIAQALSGNPAGNIGVNMRSLEWTSSARSKRIGVRLNLTGDPYFNWYSNYSGQAYVRPVFAY